MELVKLRSFRSTHYWLPQVSTGFKLGLGIGLGMGVVFILFHFFILGVLAVAILLCSRAN